MVKIAAARPTPGGYVVTVEVLNAYTDGSSRFDEVFVTRAEVTGKPPAQIKALLWALYTESRDLWRPLIGEEL